MNSVTLKVTIREKFNQSVFFSLNIPKFMFDDIEIDKDQQRRIISLIQTQFSSDNFYKRVDTKINDTIISQLSLFKKLNYNNTRMMIYFIDFSIMLAFEDYKDV